MLYLCVLLFYFIYSFCVCGFFVFFCFLGVIILKLFIYLFVCLFIILKNLCKNNLTKPVNGHTKYNWHI